MKLPKLLTRLLAAAFATAAFGAASAAPLTGSVSSVGTICLGSQPQAECSAQSVSAITYLDFIIGGAIPANLLPSPGAPGALQFLTASDDLVPLIGSTSGLINDFAIPGPGDDLATFTGVNPLWTATGSDGAAYTYALDGLTDVFRSIPNALDIRGFGTLCRDGMDCNLFSFIFTTQNTQGAVRTTFSLSQSGFPMPEPGSLALLGLGLAALAFRARRRVE